jgi:hypothetical protein
LLNDIRLEGKISKQLEINEDILIAKYLFFGKIIIQTVKKKKIFLI